MLTLNNFRLSDYLFFLYHLISKDIIFWEGAGFEPVSSCSACHNSRMVEINCWRFLWTNTNEKLLFEALFHFFQLWWLVSFRSEWNRCVLRSLLAESEIERVCVPVCVCVSVRVGECVGACVCTCVCMCVWHFPEPDPQQQQQKKKDMFEDRGDLTKTSVWGLVSLLSSPQLHTIRSYPNFHSAL